MASTCLTILRSNAQDEAVAGAGVINHVYHQQRVTAGAGNNHEEQRRSYQHVDGFLNRAAVEERVEGRYPPHRPAARQMLAEDVRCQWQFSRSSLMGRSRE